MEFISRTTQKTVTPVGASLFSERATEIKIIDEGAGEFINISQREETLSITIDPDEWPTIRSAIDAMIDKCHDVPTKGGE